MSASAIERSAPPDGERRGRYEVCSDWNREENNLAIGAFSRA